MQALDDLEGHVDGFLGGGGAGVSGNEEGSARSVMQARKFLFF